MLKFERPRRGLSSSHGLPNLTEADTRLTFVGYEMVRSKSPCVEESTLFFTFAQLNPALKSCKSRLGICSNPFCKVCSRRVHITIKTPTKIARFSRSQMLELRRNAIMNAPRPLVVHTTLPSISLPPHSVPFHVHPTPHPVSLYC